MSAGAPALAPAIPRRFRGKVVLIACASRGIGAATARRLAAEGATLVLTGRKLDAAETLLADLENASFVAGDVRARAVTEADRPVPRRARARRRRSGDGP
jgi:NADP-dependent 3-hydroxy acid dehydrogenase YdfG